MAKGALFIGWGAVIPGREQKALQVFNETLQYYAGLQQEGQIDSFEPMLLEPHGGDLGGFLIVRGDSDKLASLRASPEFLRMTTRAQVVVLNVGVVTAITGEALQSLMSDYQAQISDLV